LKTLAILPSQISNQAGLFPNIYLLHYVYGVMLCIYNTTTPKAIEDIFKKSSIVHNGKFKY